MDVHVRDVEGGAVMKVRAAPSSSRERIVGAHGDALKVAVSAPPEKGKANERLLAVIAECLGLPARRLTLVSGMTSRDKVVRVEGLDAEGLRGLLRRVVR